jgi:hypothetical protein
MENFEWATTYDMNTHEKIQNIYLCIRVLVILHNELLHKYEFGQAHCEYLTKRSLTKFSFVFFDIPTSFCEFWKFELFSAI